MKTTGAPMSPIFAREIDIHRQIKDNIVTEILHTPWYNCCKRNWLRKQFEFEINEITRLQDKAEAHAPPPTPVTPSVPSISLTPIIPNRVQ